MVLTMKTQNLHQKMVCYVEWNIAVKRSNAADTADIALGAITQVAFKICAPSGKCSAEIDGTLVDEANLINVTMPMYNLIKYSDNYSDTSGSLWSFKRDEINNDDDGLIMIMLLHLNIKQVLLVIQKTMEQKME